MPETGTKTTYIFLIINHNHNHPLVTLDKLFTISKPLLTHL